MENRNRRTPQETVSHDGFMYYTSKRSNGTRYVRCTMYPQTRCQATGKVDENGVFTAIKGHHNHDNIDDQIEGRNFKRILREACLREKGDLKNIYDRLAMRNVEGALAVPYNSIRTSMQRWRRSTRPCIPVDLEDLSRVLGTGLVRAEGHMALIFGNRQFIENFRESQYTFIDGTFKAVPRRPGFTQILTIFATCMDHAFPIFHIFMERRTRQLYDAIFSYLSRTFDSFTNRRIITDYEGALVASLRASYPEASLRGCFFHFCQALLRQAKTLGIVRQIRGNVDGRKLLRKYYALALLPAGMIEEAFNSLQGNNGELDEIFREFHDYVRRQWIQRDTPEHFSVFRQRHRTNNVMESYHRRLNSRLVRHPGIWDLMENLIEIQNIAILELEQLERQGRVFRIATRNSVFNSRLDEAWNKLEDGRFTIGDFLRQAVHFVANLDQYLEIQHEEDDAPAAIPILDPQAQPLLPLHVPIQNNPPPLIFFQPQGLVATLLVRGLAPLSPRPVPQPNVPRIEPPPLILFNAPPNPPAPEHPPNPVSHEQPPNPPSLNFPLEPPTLIFFNASSNSPAPEHPPNSVSHEHPPNPPSLDFPLEPPSLIFFNASSNPPSPEHHPNPTSPENYPNLPSPDYPQYPPSPDNPQNPPSPDFQQSPPSADFPQYPPSPDNVQHPPSPDFQQSPPSPEHHPNPTSPENYPNLPSADYPQYPSSPDYPQQPPPSNPISPEHHPNPTLPENYPNLPSPDHYFPNVPSPDYPQHPPSPEHPPSPIPVYGFPGVERLFAQLEEEEDRLFEENPRFQRRWEPRIAAMIFDEDSMDSALRCNICYLNKIQYIMTDCGHAFCTTCTDILFNEQVKCGICRMELQKEPCPIFLN